MGKRYILYVTDYYAYSILFPLEAEIVRRGDDAAWFVEERCPSEPVASRKLLRSIEEAQEYDPMAVFAPGNYIPDFFKGIKVSLFHGYPINKRAERKDDHFAIRGWFDIYCTQGPSSTGPFRRIEAADGTFRVYETGWTKADTYFSEEMLRREPHSRPVVLYSSTFTRSLTSTPILADTIEKAVAGNRWDWIFMFHPKLDDKEILARYAGIAAKYPNAEFLGNTFSADAMRRADAMLCDASSIMLEFMFMDKPVVSFRNTMPGAHLLDVTDPDEVIPALETALSRPEKLMDEIRKHTMRHEPHRDCRCSARVLDAVDDFVAAGGRSVLKRRPLNLVRKIKLRRKLHYPMFKDLL